MAPNVISDKNWQRSPAGWPRITRQARAIGWREQTLETEVTNYDKAPSSDEDELSRFERKRKIIERRAPNQSDFSLPWRFFLGWISRAYMNADSIDEAEVFLEVLAETENTVPTRDQNYSLGKFLLIGSRQSLNLWTREINASRYPVPYATWDVSSSAPPASDEYSLVAVCDARDLQPAAFQELQEFAGNVPIVSLTTTISARCQFLTYGIRFDEEIVAGRVPRPLDVMAFNMTVTRLVRREQRYTLQAPPKNNAKPDMEAHYIGQIAKLSDDSVVVEFQMDGTLELRSFQRAAFTAPESKLIEGNTITTKTELWIGGPATDSQESRGERSADTNFRREAEHDTRDIVDSEWEKIKAGWPEMERRFGRPKISWPEC